MRCRAAPRDRERCALACVKLSERAASTTRYARRDHGAAEPTGGSSSTAIEARRGLVAIGTAERGGPPFLPGLERFVAACRVAAAARPGLAATAADCPCCIRRTFDRA